MDARARILALIGRHGITVPPEKLLVLTMIDEPTLVSTLREHTLPYKDQEWRLIARKDEATQFLATVGIACQLTPELTEDLLSLAIDLNQLPPK